MKLEVGHRVCLCCKDGIHLLQIFAGASMRLLFEFVHQQELTNDELEKLITTKATEQGLAVVPAKFAVGNFYIIAPAS